MPTFDPEDQLGPWVAGVDEAGCGPWAGPVVAGAVLFDRGRIDLSAPFFKIVNDSKTLSKKKRQMLFDHLRNENGHTLHMGMGVATVEEIDQINIRQAALLAMTRALENLNVTPKGVVTDGLYCPKINMPAKAWVKGDSLSFSIAAASIVAKVTRDHIMETLAQDYPAYGWDQNAGYGTKDHQKAIETHGITPHHRTTFAPIKKWLATAGAFLWMLACPSGMASADDDGDFPMYQGRGPARVLVMHPPENAHPNHQHQRPRRLTRNQQSFLEAVTQGPISEVHRWIHLGMPVDLTDRDGWTPLMNALDKGKTRIAQALILHGANVNARDDEGTTPLMIACEMGQAKMASFLIRYGANVHAENSEEWNALMIAFMGSHVRIVKNFVARGGNPNTRLPGSISLLEWAVDLVDLKFVELLMKKGARDDDHETALNAAKRKGQLGIARLINPQDPEVVAEFTWQDRVNRLHENGALNPDKNFEFVNFVNVATCTITDDLLRFPVRALYKDDNNNVRRYTPPYEHSALQAWLVDPTRLDPMAKVNLPLESYEPDRELADLIGIYMDLFAPLYPTVLNPEDVVHFKRRFQAYQGLRIPTPIEP